LIGAKLGQDVDWKKEQMKGQNKIYGVKIRGLLRLVNYFFVAFYLYFITAAVIIVQNFDQILLVIVMGNL
jgi:hypothetical protein